MKVLKSIFYISARVNHWFRSKSSAGHGVHSPFVYNFLRTTLRGETDQKLTASAGKLRAEMLSAKSREFDFIGEEKQLRTDLIRARTKVVLPPHQTAILARIAAAECKGTSPADGIVLELGTSLGITTLCLAAAAPENKIISIEPCREISEIAYNNLTKTDVKNVRILNDDFSVSLGQLKSEGKKIRFAFINAEEAGVKTEDYFNSIVEMSADSLTLVIDGIHSGRILSDEWKRISGKISLRAVTVETGRFGIVFIRKSITPGAYVIRC